MAQFKENDKKFDEQKKLKNEVNRVEFSKELNEQIDEELDKKNSKEQQN
ncbi:hypothetical protein [Sporolactobacillus laevolacticus]|nr:hypothetical protein [Sporolactobacillus laevolacticus]MDN3956730.1 hypothetical protein [Sporolactobacillus laevolacticus]